jgi:hypothetical protein
MKCIVCKGACCEEIVLTSAIIGADFPKVAVEFLEARGIPTGNGCYAISARCPKLTDDGLCSIHEDKPLACALEPVGGEACYSAVRRRRTKEDYQEIRDDDDPETWEEFLNASTSISNSTSS